MQLTLKTQIIILVAVLGIGFILGTMTHKQPSSVTTNTDIKQEKDIHEHKTTTITKSKDGTTTTKITDDKDTHADADTKSHTLVKSRSVNVSALAGVSTHDPLIPIYGVQITKPLFSNLTIGGYAMTNGTLGVSLGWDF